MVMIMITNSTWPSRWQLLYPHEAAVSTALLLHPIFVLSYFQLRNNKYREVIVVEKPVLGKIERLQVRSRTREYRRMMIDTSLVYKKPKSILIPYMYK